VIYGAAPEGGKWALSRVKRGTRTAFLYASLKKTRRVSNCIWRLRANLVVRMMVEQTRATALQLDTRHK
jgi:hypothetical protein